MANAAFFSFQFALLGFWALAGVLNGPLAHAADVSDAADAPIEIRVAVLVNFEVGQDTGDAPGEFQAWHERGLNDHPG
ncbi:hypothetical protein [Congregibacter sp.]|uniref:hypothetical protein n=1 Tax=Congregibacter sp. TaxID=2744308 RepID=UPI003F6B194D